MGRLHVSVWYQGMVVDDRVLAVYDGMRLGEAPTAEVAFPGVDIAVRRAGERLLVRGRWLGEGEELHLHLGGVQVHLEHLESRRLFDWTRLVGDPRILVGTLAVALSGVWWEAVQDFVDRDPSASRALAGLAAHQSWLRGLGSGPEVVEPAPLEEPVEVWRLVCADVEAGVDVDTGLPVDERLCVVERTAEGQR